MSEPLRRTLGQTGLQVLAVGLGGGQGLSADDYRRALDLGVEYVDTARVYLKGEDERRLGQALQGGRRERVVLATKTMARTVKAAKRDLHTSLRALRTDWVDVWQMHYVNTPQDLKRVLGPGGALEAALQAQEEGKVRFIGVTGHLWEQMQADVESDRFATVLCWYNCALRQAEETVLPAAQAHAMGVVIMNTTRWGRLQEPPPGWREPVPTPQDLYRFVLSHPAVHVAISGIKEVEHLEANLRAAHDFQPLSREERDWLVRYGDAVRATGRLEG